jgi:4-azaleucine resistance transporter AzlC
MSEIRHIEWKTVVSASFPIMMGYIPLGMAFGYLLQTNGASWWLAPLMSLFVFAGAAQFLAIPMLAAQLSIGEIAVATLIVNLRHIFYGLSLLDGLPDNRLKRFYMIYALTDENYSVLTTLKGEHSDNFRFAVTALNHFYWVIGALVGALIGNVVPNRIEGIEFSLTALFVVLAVEQAYSVKSAAPFLIAGLSFLAARLAFPDQSLFVAILLSATLGFFHVRSGLDTLARKGERNE